MAAVRRSGGQDGGGGGAGERHDGGKGRAEGERKARARDEREKHAEGRTPDHDVSKRTEIFLGEFRIIVPGLAALLGFLLNATFSTPFESLPRPEQRVHLAGILSNLLALAFLLGPTSYHRFVSRLENTEEFLRFARRHFAVAFVFIALTFVLALYIQVFRVTGLRTSGAVFAAGLALLLFLLWWIVPLGRARRKGIRDPSAAAVK